MKKLLLILLCLPFIGFGQFQYKLDSTTAVWQSQLTGNVTNIFTYDLQGRIIQEESFVDNTPYSNVIFTYDSNNLIETREIFVNLDSINWLSQVKEVYVYNANNMIEECERLVWNFTQSTWEESQKDIYFFNFNNEITKVERYNWMGSIYELSAKHEYSYLSSEITIEEGFQYNNGIWELEYMSKYYSLNGNSVVDSAFSLQNGNWIYQSRHSQWVCNSNLTSETVFPFGQPIIRNYPWKFFNQLTHRIMYDNGEVITQLFHYSPFSGTSSVYEGQSTNKELLKITDLLGRETKGTKNEILFYIYDDGTVEKRIVIE